MIFSGIFPQKLPTSSGVRPWLLVASAARTSRAAARGAAAAARAVQEARVACDGQSGWRRSVKHGDFMEISCSYGPTVINSIKIMGFCHDNLNYRSYISIYNC